MIFQPAINYVKPFTEQKKNLLFIDNSKSMQLTDSIQIKEITSAINENLTNSGIDFEVYSFSDFVKPFESQKFKLTGQSTNYENLFSFIQNQQPDVATVSIISDGNSNAGKLTDKKIEYLNTPIFTVGLGDTTLFEDISIKKINYNPFIYSNTPTEVELIIETTSPGKNVNVSISGDVEKKETKTVKLEKNFTRVVFDFSSASPGKKKVNFQISNLKNEKNINNNSKSVILNVFKDKIKIGLLSGSLSMDYRFVKNILEKDEKKKLLEVVKISNTIKKNSLQDFSDLDAVFIIGFPSQINKDSEINNLINLIQEKKLPFFFMLTKGTDYTKLSQLSSILKFNYEFKDNIQYNLITPEIKEFNSPLVKNSTVPTIAAWQNLPPVLQPDIEFSATPGSNIISTVKKENIGTSIPLIFTNNFNGIKSVYTLAGDIWKWKLNKSENVNVLENFINSSVKWLLADEELKNISVKPAKEIFDSGEPIEFSGKVFNETFAPINDAVVEITLNENGSNKKIVLSYEKNGHYSGSFELTKSGKYDYRVNVTRSNNSIFSEKGSFEISNSDFELKNGKLNKDYLEKIAYKSDGKYFSFEKLSTLFDQVRKIHSQNQLIIDKNYSISLHLNQYALFLVILLFTTEWLLRKYWKLL